MRPPRRPGAGWRWGVIGALGTAATLGVGLPSARPAHADAAGAGPGISLPGPSPRARDVGHDTVAENRACASCHQAIAAEWEGSLHHEAWVDPVFQAAYAIEKQAFCRGCHAPEADAAAEPDAGAQQVGVGCTTCHVQGATIVSANASPGAPHGVFEDARMATKSACAGCHQFDFPGLDMPMQDTLAEHESSSFAGTACQTCHMPTVSTAGGNRHRSHAFAVISNPDMIRSAATVSARRVGPKEVEVTIASAVVGHAFPTGDMFRRLEVRASAVDASGAVIATADPVHLGRLFNDRPHRPGGTFERMQLSDTRVPPPGAGGPRRIALRFDRPVGAAEIVWGVYYQRMGSAMAASFGIDQATDEVVVEEGELAPTPAIERTSGEQAKGEP